MSLVKTIKEALNSIWEWIKKISVKILTWKDNIVNWFKEPDRLEEIRKNKQILAISIKENLKNGNYNVINCLFNEQTSELVDYQENTIAIEANSIDGETDLKFGEKEMVVLSNSI